MKKNSVRILALLLAALLALSACGGKDTTTQPGGDAPAGNEPAGEPGQPGQPDNGGEAITDFVDFQLQSSEIRTFCLLNSEDSVNSNVLCNAYSPLLELNNKSMQKIRGSRLSMISQDPMTSLNPVMRVVEQVSEVLLLHKTKSRVEAVKMAKEVLLQVGIKEDRVMEYPHQFSGGMRQRVGIAMALACSPEVLNADEPTTALDVTIQAQVLELMKNLKKQYEMSMIMITHDLGIVAEICDYVAVMYAGSIVEYGDKRMTPDPSKRPQGCPFAPRCGRATERCFTGSLDAYEIEPGHWVRCLQYMKEDT